MADNICNTHSGWTINDSTSGISWNTGVLEQMDSSCTLNSYNVKFCGWEDTPHSTTVITTSCNDCDMFVTWFDSTNNFYPLNSSAATQFCIKNVNDCEFIATTTDPINYCFIENGNNGQIPYVSSGYTDSGIPMIYSQSSITVTSASNANKSYSDTPKFSAGTNVDRLNKIKYKLTDNNHILKTNTITRNNKLREIYIPKSVNQIQDGAFSGNTNLTAVTMTDVKTIGQGAFSGCTNLTEINVNFNNDCKGPTTLNTIGASAFCNTNINYVLLPSSVTSVGEYAFTGNKLKYIKIPSNINDVTYSQNGLIFGGEVCYLGIDLNDSRNVTLNTNFVVAPNANTVNVMFYGNPNQDTIKRIMSGLIQLRGVTTKNVYTKHTPFNIDDDWGDTQPLSYFTGVTLSGGGFMG